MWQLWLTWCDVFSECIGFFFWFRTCDMHFVYDSSSKFSHSPSLSSLERREIILNHTQSSSLRICKCHVMTQISGRPVPICRPEMMAPPLEPENLHCPGCAAIPEFLDGTPWVVNHLHNKENSMKTHLAHHGRSDLHILHPISFHGCAGVVFFFSARPSPSNALWNPHSLPWTF